MASSSGELGEGAATSASSQPRMAGWASKLGRKAMELKAATQEAVQQTKQAFAAEAKLVARDMVDFKEGVAEGVRLTVQDTSGIRERLGRETRKVFHSEASEAGTEPAEAGEKKGFFRTEELKGKVEDLKAGGKKAAEKVRDVGGRLWHQTDHWWQSLRRHEGGQSWEDCHQAAVQLCAGGSVPSWALEKLKTGDLEPYSSTAVLYYEAKSKTRLEELFHGGYTSAAEPPPSLLAYCHTPVSEGFDVHLVSYSQHFLDLEHPENQFFVPMSSEKRKALEQKMRWLIRGVYAQAEKLGLQEVVWQFSGDELSQRCGLLAQELRPPEVQLSSAMPELTEAALPAALFVSQDLWRVQGGEFASRSASSLLCWPGTNPHLSQVPLTWEAESSVAPQELSPDTEVFVLEAEEAAEASSTANGSPGAARSISQALEASSELDSKAPEPSTANGSALETSSRPQEPLDELDWLDNLDALPAATSQPQASQGPADDFDTLWDSMIDEVSPKANGA